MLNPPSITVKQNLAVDHLVYILLVDGRRSIYRKITQHFAGTHYDWVTAGDHLAALEKISRRRFELILLGPDVAHEQRLNIISIVNAIHPSPTVLVSIFPGQEDLAVEALQRGASNYIIEDENDGFLTLLPMVVANILRRRQLEHEKASMLNLLKQRNLVLTSLNRIGSELTSILEPERLINRLMRAAIEIVNAEGGSLWLIEDESPEKLVCRAVLHRTNAPPLIGVERHKNEGIVGWVATHNQCTILDHVDTDSRFSPDVDQRIKFQTRALMAVPLRLRDRVIGVLEFVNKLHGRFDEDDLVVAETLAATASTAMENARLVDKLRLYTIDLEERNEELNAFGYTLAHDLQNILARITGFADIIQNDFRGEQSQLNREQLVRASFLISRNAYKMSSIIDALLLFSSVRSAEVEFTPVCMSAILEEVFDRLADEIDTAKAIITTAKEWPKGVGYAPWIEEVWFNYLSNALKYGGIPPHIELGSHLHNNRKEICFWINDNGHGVNPEFAHNLFRPFKQYNPEAKDGHGLGLSIVARIVERMGGSVGYRTNPEGGSSFYFTLPAAK